MTAELLDLLDDTTGPPPIEPAMTKLPADYVESVTGVLGRWWDRTSQVATSTYAREAIEVDLLRQPAPRRSRAWCPASTSRGWLAPATSRRRMLCGSTSARPSTVTRSRISRRLPDVR